MAVPALPENNTARLFITYTSGGGSNAQEHTLSVRFNSPGATPSGIMDDLADVLNAEGNDLAFFNGWRVLRAEVQEEGAIVRLPVDVPLGLLAFVGDGDASVATQAQAREIRYVGRGLVSGRKVTLSLYGVSNAQITEQDFRFTPSPTGTLGDLLALFTSYSVGGLAFTAIDGGATNWYNYVNWQYNSHWESELRA